MYGERIGYFLQFCCYREGRNHDRMVNHLIWEGRGGLIYEQRVFNTIKKYKLRDKKIFFWILLVLKFKDFYIYCLKIKIFLFLSYHFVCYTFRFILYFFRIFSFFLLINMQSVSQTRIELKLKTT